MPTINSLLPPYPTFLDAQGNPLNGGFIYIGQPGLEARTTPKASFFDEALTIPTGTATGAAVRTSAGYPVGHNGSPANVYVDGDYSITVTTAAGVVVFSALFPGFTFDIGATGGPILAPDGNLTTTGFGFVAEQDTGFIRPAPATMQTVVDGVLVATATPGGTTFAQPVTAPNTAVTGTLNVAGATTAAAINGTNITASGQLSAATFAGAGVQTVLAASATQVPNGNAVVNALLGFGQTWQNLTGSRSSGVVYTNGTSKPIEIRVTTAVVTGSATFEVGVNSGSLLTISQTTTGGGTSVRQTNGGIVPPGHAYRYTGNVDVWAELRA